MRYSTTILLLYSLSFFLLISFSYSAPFWLQTITHNGLSAFNPSPQTYPVWRNVKDYGAKGDGITDDTAAIQAATVAGARCGLGCGSSTITPAIVYFPTGTYLVSAPLIQYYYTQYVGDAGDPPTLLAADSMHGYLIQSDPYDDHGNSWWQNQDNFYRQVRNFIIDLTRCPSNVNCVGIHWQVAQATSITNVVIKMSTANGNQHQGVWMENGSGGFMSDLVFVGGKNAMWVGNQQFTSRNLTISNSQTGIYMNWNWGWTFKSLNINNCQIGVDISASSNQEQQDGSIVLMDATITNTAIGVQTVVSSSSKPVAGGSMILDNVRFSNVQRAVSRPDGSVILAGGSFTVASWGQGRLYNNTGNSQNKGSFYQGYLSPPNKPSILLNSQTGRFFERPRPQYAEYSVNNVVNIKLEGAMGNGKSDDTQAIQNVLNKYSGQNVILFFPAGSYLISNTVVVPAGSKIVGEVWSVIMATGSNFGNINNPKPVWQIGNAGQVGGVELSDLLFSNQGPVPGAIMVQWNLRDPPGQQGANGMWDVHFRMGGAMGTDMLYADCSAGSQPTARCMAAFLMLHLTASSSCYVENMWGWTADHDLDSTPGGQTSIYTGRGFLIESQNGPVWMYGTAAEHNVMYQYNLVNTQNVMMGMIQIETPYYQSSPPAPAPFVYRQDFNDPDFSTCPRQSQTCPMAWGLRMINTHQTYVYGAGLYSFFNNYNQNCLTSEHCQDSMVALEKSRGNVYVYNLSTKAAMNMVVGDNGVPYIEQDDNESTFCATVVGDLTNANS